MTLTPVAERLAVEMSLSVFTSWACGGWDSNTQPSACDANALTDCANAAASKNVYMSAASCIQCMVSVLCPIKDGRSDARLRVCTTQASGTDNRSVRLLVVVQIVAVNMACTISKKCCSYFS